MRGVSTPLFLCLSIINEVNMEKAKLKSIHKKLKEILAELESEIYSD